MTDRKERGNSRRQNAGREFESAGVWGDDGRIEVRRNQRKMKCAVAGCGLTGLARDELDTASVLGKNRSVANDNTHQLTLLGTWRSSLRRGVSVSVWCEGRHFSAAQSFVVDVLPFADASDEKRETVDELA